jgi:serine/threonine-protein kinase RsbW
MAEALEVAAVDEDPPLGTESDAGELVVQLDVTLAADVANISPVVEEVLRAVRESGCGPEGHFEVETALREALANAITHGSGNDRSKPVRCWVACDREGDVVIVVRDSGPGFNPLQLSSPLAGQNLYAHHGRGIYLINQLMDEVRFDRGGTEIRMRKRLPPGNGD